jgi:hypothetical protein
MQCTPRWLDIAALPAVPCRTHSHCSTNTLCHRNNDDYRMTFQVVLHPSDLKRCDRAARDAGPAATPPEQTESLSDDDDRADDDDDDDDDDDNSADRQTREPSGVPDGVDSCGFGTREHLLYAMTLKVSQTALFCRTSRWCASCMLDTCMLDTCMHAPRRHCVNPWDKQHWAHSISLLSLFAVA